MQPLNIMALTDGCLALFDQPVELKEGESVELQYLSDCLQIDCGELEILIPIGYLDHMSNSAFISEEGAAAANVHLFWRQDGCYEAIFAGTITITAETFVKAKGVAEYLASSPR